MISVSWLHFACKGKDEITDGNSEAPRLQGRPAGLPWRILCFLPKITFNVDGNPLENRQMMRSRMGIQVRV